MMGLGATLCSPKNSMDVQVSEMEGPSATDICNIQIATHGELIFKFWYLLPLCVIEISHF